MIKKYVSDIAKQMGVILSKVSLVDGDSVGCRDSHILRLAIGDNLDSILIFRKEMEELESGVLERKVRRSIQSMIEDMSNS